MKQVKMYKEAITIFFSDVLTYSHFYEQRLSERERRTLSVRISLVFKKIADYTLNLGSKEFKGKLIKIIHEKNSDHFTNSISNQRAARTGLACRTT